MSERNWTPYQIEILLHHHSSRARFARQEAPAYEPEVHALTKLGVLEEREGVIRTTPLGDALIAMLLQTPLPRAVLIDPRSGKEVQPEAGFASVQIRDTKFWSNGIPVDEITQVHIPEAAWNRYHRERGRTLFGTDIPDPQGAEAGQ